MTPGEKAMLHRIVSYAKSAVRIVGYVALVIAGVPMNGHDIHPRHLIYAGVMLIFAELLGIAEEYWGS